MGHRVFLSSLAFLLLPIIISTEHTRRHAQAAAVTQGMVAGVGSNSMMRSMVGSRPPSCAGRCWWCGGRSCVAVQVPITPQDDKVRGRGGGARASSSSSLSSYEDHSNYKPLSWRCKCGGGAAVGLKP